MKHLPHVTTIIREAGLMPPVYDEAANDAKAILGTEVHRLCARRKAPPGPAGDYARSFLRWLEETGAKVLRSEFKVRGVGLMTGRTIHYVGRCDLELEWKGDRWVIDIKTGAVGRWHGVQVAAYSVALGDALYKPGILWLSPSRAKLYADPPIISPGDYEAWDACLKLWYWKHGLRQRILPRRRIGPGKSHRSPLAMPGPKDLNSPENAAPMRRQTG
jgi:hypothetical protein